MKNPDELKDETELKMWQYLAATYDVENRAAYSIAIDLCRSCQFVADSDAHIREHKLIVENTNNGAPYQNPSVGIRNKASSHRDKCWEKLEKYKRGTGGAADRFGLNSPAPVAKTKGKK